MVYNLVEFKSKNETVKEHVLLAEKLLQGLTVKNMDFELELSNKSLMALR